MAKARFEGSTPAATGRRWHLVVIECTDHRLALAGLPEDREERLALVTRLRDLLSAVSHADDIGGAGDAALWRRYARVAFAAWASEVRVEYVAAEREVAAPPE